MIHPAVRRAGTSLVAAALMLILGGPAAAQALYPAFTLQSNPGSPRRMLMDDFTGDGVADLVVASPGDGRIRVHARTADGEISGGVSVFVGGAPSAIFAVDFDHDGDTDLAFCDERSGAVGILLFAPGNPPPYLLLTQRGPDEPTGIVATDVDGDGWEDLLAAHGGADEVVAYPNLRGVVGPGMPEPAGDRPDRLLLLRHADGPTLALRQSGRLSRDLHLTNLLDESAVVLPLGGVGEIFAVDMDGDGSDELLLADELAGEMVVREYGGGAWPESFRFEIDAGVTGVAVADVGNGERKMGVASRERRRVAVYDVSPGLALRRSQWYSGGETGDVLFRDVDSDGAPDLVVAQGPLNRLQFMHPLGDGYFAMPASSAPAGGTSLVRGQEPGGQLLFAVSGAADARVGVYRVEGVRLGEPTLLEAAPGVRAVRFGDLDGVAGTDLVSVSRTGGVRIHLSDGAGGWAPRPGFVPAAQVADLTLVDVIGGPALDLVLASLDPASLIVYEGFGDGSFGATPAAQIATTEPLVVVRAHDLDLDGRKDLVALGFDSLLTIFMNRAGQPLAGAELLVRNAPRDVAFGRFNADAFPDMVTINEGNSDFSIVNSVLSGVYTVVIRGVPSLPGASRVEVADINSDGVDDFCVVASGTRSVGIHLNTGTPEEPLFRFTPPIQYELVDTATDLSIPDLDGDGTPDLVGLDGIADVVAVRLSDPFVVAGNPSAAIVIDDQVTPRRIVVWSDADYAHDLRLTREPGDAVLPLTKVAPGRFEAFDAASPFTEVTYVVLDRQGQELDRMGVGARSATAAPPGIEPGLLPVRYEPGRAILRMRAGAGVVPEVRIYDLRGRRVAELEVLDQGSGWFEASWAGTDLRGRPVSRGRYLVRASLGPTSGTRSIHLR